jgi:predicted DNA-binding protein
MLYMASSRTQVYLTDQQRRRLDDRGRREGVTLAHLIREAVDSYLSEDELSADDALDETFGVLPDLDVPSRSEWDRG